MKSREWPVLLVVFLAASGCFQVGPKEEPIHIILDVNIKVQIERDVEDLWDAIEEDADSGEGSESP